MLCVYVPQVGSGLNVVVLSHTHKVGDSFVVEVFIFPLFAVVI